MTGNLLATLRKLTWRPGLACKAAEIYQRLEKIQPVWKHVQNLEVAESRQQQRDHRQLYFFDRLDVAHVCIKHSKFLARHKNREIGPGEPI